MRRTFALIVAVAVVLVAAPAVGANPNAVEWVETDVMGAPTDVVTRFAGDWIHEQFSRSGTFTACAGTDCSHAGNVGWTAAGKIRLDEAEEFPVFGTFRAKGYYEFTAGSKTGVTCQSTFQSKLVEDTTVFPPFVFYGNQVAHCSDGSRIHGRIFGPTAPGSAPMGFHQTVTGTLRN